MAQKKYSDEFREMIVELHRSGKPPCEIMRENGLSSSAYTYFHYYEQAKLCLFDYL